MSDDGCSVRSITAVTAAALTGLPFADTVTSTTAERDRDQQADKHIHSTKTLGPAGEFGPDVFWRIGRQRVPEGPGREPKPVLWVFNVSFDTVGTGCRK